MESSWEDGKLEILFGNVRCSHNTAYNQDSEQTSHVYLRMGLSSKSPFIK